VGGGKIILNKKKKIKYRLEDRRTRSAGFQKEEGMEFLWAKKSREGRGSKKAQEIRDRNYPDRMW